MKYIIEIRCFYIKRRQIWLSKLGCHGSVNVEVHVTTTILNFT